LVTRNVTKGEASPLLERFGATTEPPDERWIAGYSIAHLAGQEFRAKLAHPESLQELAMTVGQVSCATHEAPGLLLRRLEADRSRTPRKCHDFGAPVNRSYSVDDFVRVVDGRGWRIAGSANNERSAQQLVVDPWELGDHRDVEEVARERSPD
jgi:hypothetical protein